MALFSEADINEAKRRVREMQSKANAYSSESDESKISSAEVENAEDKEKNGANHNTSENQNKANNNGGGLFGLFASEDKSQIIILALALILSREGADNQLIMALLYLLL